MNVVRTGRLVISLFALFAVTSCDTCSRKKDTTTPASSADAAQAGPVVVAEDGGVVRSASVIPDDVAGKVAGPIPKSGKVKAGLPMAVQCTAKGQAVSPTIFGIAWADGDKDIGATAHRWGGNTTSRYNPKLGNAWSTANDWFWENIEI